MSGYAVLDRVEDVGARGDDLLDAVAGLELEILDEAEKQRIRHRDRQQVLLDADGDAGALSATSFEYQNDRGGVGNVLRGIDVRARAGARALRNLALR